MGLTNEYGTFYYHPTFLYESLWNILGFILLHFYSKKRKYDGEVFIMYLGWYGLGRLFIEGLRQDSLYLFGTSLRVSQVVALLCLIISVALLLYHKIGKTHDPDELWVNRDMIKESEPAEPLEDEEEDEELSDVYKALTKSAEPEDTVDSGEETAAEAGEDEESDSGAK